MLHNEGGLQFSDNNTSISSYQGHMGSKTLQQQQQQQPFNGL